MFLIVGLGNPGEKYKNTRHNAGFMVLNEVVKRNKLSDFKFSKKNNAELSENLLNNKKIILAKPQTYMNNSGKAIKKLYTLYKIQNANLFVIHDDIDLPLNKIRVSKNRGAAGHKGIESVIKEIGTKNFIRFRIGIRPKINKPKNPEMFVLQKFGREEKETIEKIIQETAEAIEFSIKNGVEKAMNKFNN